MTDKFETELTEVLNNWLNPEEGDEESQEQPVTKSEVKEDVKSTEDVSAAFDDLFNN